MDIGLTSNMHGCEMPRVMFHRCILSLIVLSFPSLMRASEPPAVAVMPAEALYATYQTHNYFSAGKTTDRL